MRIQFDSFDSRRLKCWSVLYVHRTQNESVEQWDRERNSQTQNGIDAFILLGPFGWNQSQSYDTSCSESNDPCQSVAHTCTIPYRTSTVVRIYLFQRCITGMHTVYSSLFEWIYIYMKVWMNPHKFPITQEQNSNQSPHYTYMHINLDNNAIVWSCSAIEMWVWLFANCIPVGTVQAGYTTYSTHSYFYKFKI